METYGISQLPDMVYDAVFLTIHSLNDEILSISDT
jgi:hypothetical protein